MIEETLIIIKPDGVARKLEKEIMARFLRKGFTIEEKKKQKINRKLAEQHYAEHVQKPFFDELVEFICSGPVWILKVKGESAINRSRELIGATDFKKALPGTIRHDFAESISRNVIHGSDSVSSAKRELKLFFGK